MVDITPRPTSQEDRVLLLEAAVEDLQEWKADRTSRDQYLVTTVVALIGVVAIFFVAYIHP